ncbi:activated protein kinase catalytic subunit alpha-1 [Seminavis robusta]|uniref:Activated protein kinase catalytic subunit alpha-1 n=1 Tax=Seminavis robusta TaxID=568900 RepID=A0A9N8H913_9STRA|nr:activated protein kinase catalytic subunit alpha-1 [Seminavis robusta]|eukprot:Sro189_g081400.1 activated protein kinase catalytic subunit alpha-1 (469) ;mRNA; f:8698-10460
MPAKRSSAATARPSVDANGKAKAKMTVEAVFAQSAIVDRVGEYPKFTKEEMQLGKLLGKGGFGSVFEIRSFTLGGKKVLMNQKKGFSDDLNDTDYGNASNNHQSARMFIAQHCLRNNSDARYAVKQLSPEVISNAGMFYQGMMDMALETRFMSDIQHPNIVKIRSMAKCEPYDERYFIIMDRLYDTLERRIQKVWLPKAKVQNSFFGKNLLDRKGAKRNDLLEERVVYAFDLAAAINYLHERQILYRDIKPENIGFDVRDDIKLFDFGLAKELRDDLKTEDGLYKLTGDTGSPRYMAPEVAFGKPYNSTCDTYSFCILLWQMLALTTPFEVYTVKKLKERVWSSMEKRPLINETWSANLKLLLKRGWANDLTVRFTMKQVEGILRKECIRIRDGNDSGLEHQRRRSTFVFRGSKAGEKGAPINVKPTPSRAAVLKTTHNTTAVAAKEKKEELSAQSAHSMSAHITFDL